MLRAILPWVTALLCLCLTLPLTAQSSSTGGGRDGGESENATDCVGTCSANAGGAISICTEETLILNGTLPGVSDPMPQWVASPDNPTPTFIESPNELQTVVTADDGGMLMPGEYLFTLTVTCSDGTMSCDDVVVTVVELEEITIDDHEEVTCQQSFTFVGSPIPPGGTVTWSVEPDDGASFEEDGNTFTIDNLSNSSNCSYTVTYRQFFAGCEKETSSSIEFIQSYGGMATEILDIDCALGAVLRGRNAGCGGTPSWTYLEGPTPSEDMVISNSTSRQTSVLGTIPGPHTFAYTINNGVCPTTVATITVVLVDECDDCTCDLGADEFTFTCDLFEDIGTITLNSPNLCPGFDIKWEVLFSPVGLDVNIAGADDQNTVTLAIEGNVLSTQFSNTITVRLTKIDPEDPECLDFIDYKLYSWPPSISAISPELFFNCNNTGGYRLTDNLTFNGSLVEYIVDEAPDGFPADLLNVWLPLGQFTELNVELEGTYRIRATNRTFGGPSDQSICEDVASFTIIVNDVPTINAGADQVLCATSTQLNGSIPLNRDFEPVDIPVFWEQIGEPTVTFSATDVPDPVITGLQYGEVYEFKYSFPGDPDCIREDIVTVTINPEGECCQLSIETKCDFGCTTFRLEGADTYVANNEDVVYLGGGRFQVCQEEPVTVTFTGFDENGEVCGSITQITEPCEIPDPECDFRLTTGCDFCGCQEVKGIVRVIDIYGNVANALQYDFAWSIDGVPFESEQGAISFIYSEPVVVDVTVTFTEDDGSLCVWTDAIYVSCLGECPEIEFRTCDDADFADEEDCERGGGCSFGAYTGPVWVVDPAGDPINTSSFIVNWEIENGSVSGNNPYYLQTSNSIENCGSDVKAILTNREKDCETEAEFSYDCCSNAPVEIECHQLERGYELQWWGSCSTTAYQVTVVTYTGQVFTAIVPANEENIYPIPAGTPDAFYSVRAICASGELGPAHNCISISSAFGCSYFDVSCLDLIGIESTGSTSGGGRPKDGKSSIFPNPVQNGPLSLSLADELLGNAKPYLVTVYSALGKSMHRQVIEPFTKTVSIETQRIPKGLNYLIIRTPDGKAVETIKFIKQ